MANRSEASKARRRAYSREYCRKWRKAHKEKQREYSKRNYELRASQHHAKTKAGRALERGLIQRATVCADCGLPKKLEMHHPDYSRPLEIVWLCTDCHHLRHHPR